jgi:hypothetical protein
MSISISGIQGSAAFVAPSIANTAPSGNATSALQGELIANLDLASSGVSAALQSLSSSLGSLLDTTA